MKHFILLLTLLAAVTTSNAQPMTTGNYRIPYGSSVTITALVDHTTHALSNRVDLQGITTGVSNYPILAVEEGYVRAIRDAFGGTNYVWIEHANGEWSGYFYVRANSVQGTFGLTIGDFVTNGQPIAMEGTVGSPGGPRLRFEVGVPANANDPIVVGTGRLKGENRLPAICNIPENVLRVGRSYSPRSCFAQEFSHAIYRLPYTNGTAMTFGGDHLTHSPSKTRLDLNGMGDPNNNYAIVAAASGWIMAIVDNFNVTCTSSNGCSDFNNYVWIAHANGEWTKYTHFKKDSVRQKAKLVPGQFVTAGTYLGDEGTVGFAFGQHLHFEVGFPFDTNSTPIQVNGGFLTNGVNRIPLFCDIPGNVGYAGDVFVTGPCSGGGCTANLVLPADTIRDTKAYVAAQTVDSNNANIRVDTYGSLALLAGNKITLRPGFHATFDSYVRAAIRPCNAPP